MKAIKVTSYGDADVLRLSDGEPKPAPSARQVLVKIHAAGVNFVDIYQRRGTYPLKLPFIPGLEAAGVVEAAGDAGAIERVEGVEPELEAAALSEADGAVDQGLVAHGGSLRLAGRGQQGQRRGTEGDGKREGLQRPPYQGARAQGRDRRRRLQWRRPW